MVLFISRKFQQWNNFAALRILLVVLVIATSLLIPDHIPDGAEQLYLDDVPYWVTPFIRWDSAHFLNISLYGYRREHQYVFYPLYPSILSLFAGQGIGMMVAISLALNCVCSFVAFKSLRELLFPTSLPRDLVDDACEIFLLYNPGTVFFVTTYTESIFAALSWTGILWTLSRKPRLKLAGSILLLMASCTRSNGVLNICFIGGYSMSQFYLGKEKLASWYSLHMTFTGLCILLPNLLWNLYSYHAMCSSPAYGNESLPTICAADISWWGSYGYLQRKYWDVGFLQQYQLRQIPNFLLASPILYFSIAYLVNIMSSYSSTKLIASIFADELLGWKLHLMVSTAVCMFFAHVQVSTRVLCASSPFIYISMAQHLRSSHPSCRWWTSCFLVTYLAFGLILHCNNYPWT